MKKITREHAIRLAVERYTEFGGTARDGYHLLRQEVSIWASSVRYLTMILVDYNFATPRTAARLAEALTQ